MSWTRRALVLLAFVLMVGGVALMVIQREELFLTASVAGFALVLAVVPSLPRQRSGDATATGESGAEAAARGQATGADEGEAAGADPEASASRPSGSWREGRAREQDEAALPARQWTGNVTVLPQTPDWEGRKEDASAEAPEEDASAEAPEDDAPAEAPAIDAPAEGPEDEAPAEGLAIEAPAETPGGDASAHDEHLSSPSGDGASAGGEPAEAASGPLQRAARPQPPPASGPRSSVGDVSPRSVAIAGATAGALLWLWRRARR